MAAVRWSVTTDTVIVTATGIVVCQHRVHILPSVLTIYLPSAQGSPGAHVTAPVGPTALDFRWVEELLPVAEELLSASVAFAMYRADNSMIGTGGAIRGFCWVGGYFGGGTGDVSRSTMNFPPAIRPY